MTLRELLDAARDRRDRRTPGGATPEITGLAYRSESVTPGALFFCVPGFVVDGHDFAPDAVERGAAALVCERPLGLGRAGGRGAERARGDGAARGRASTATHRRSCGWSA